MIGIMAYAHTSIIDPRDRQRYDAGDVVPDDLPGYDELVEGGAIANEAYDPEQDRLHIEPPDTIEIDGVVYHKAVTDSAGTDDAQA